MAIQRVRFQMRQGTAAAWTTENGVLYVGEWGYESDTGKLKIGDGVTAWNTLPYSQAGSSDALTGINEQTGTTYTLVLADATKGVRMTNAATCALTIPANASVALPLYVALPIFQGGAGVVSIAGATGVTIEAASGQSTIGVGDFRTIFQRATDVWVIG